MGFSLVALDMSHKILVTIDITPNQKQQSHQGMINTNFHPIDIYFTWCNHVQLIFMTKV